MFDFIKNAFAELTHVVWPTRKESIKYMTYTVGTIIIVGIFLAILGYAIRELMTLTRNQFPHTPLTNTTVSGEDFATKADLEKLENFANARKNQSGSTVSHKTLTGTLSTSGTTLSGSGQ